MSSISLVKKQRYDKYMAIIEGMDKVTVRYLADATHISPTVVMYDLKEMVAAGYFGKSAYINYLDNSLVLKNEVKSQRSSGTPSSAPKTAGAAQVREKSIAEKHKGIKPKLLPLVLIAGVILLGAGLWNIGIALDNMAVAGIEAAGIWSFIKGGLLGISGGVMLIVRSVKNKRFKRCSKIVNVIADKKTVQIAEIASSTGFSKSVVRSEIRYLIEKGVLPPKACMDSHKSILYLDGVPEKTEEKNAETSKNKYYETICEIRRLNDEIADPVLSEKIHKIEEITGKIFRTVEDKPEKEPQIRTFMNYYLPATLKLLRSYSMLEDQGVDGENIMAAKKSIENIMDKLVSGFSKQLDQLFMEDALDITSDVDVLNTMMERDGLSGEGSAFAAADN